MRRATVREDSSVAKRGEKRCLASLNPFIERQSQPRSVSRSSNPPLETANANSSTGILRSSRPHKPVIDST